MTEQVVEDLENTMRVLDAHGWCQGVSHNRDGQVCLEGALAVAVSGTPTLFGATIQQCGRFNAGLRALNNALGGYAHQYNDLPTTSVEDVKLLLKRTIEEASK